MVWKVSSFTNVIWPLNAERQKRRKSKKASGGLHTNLPGPQRPDLHVKSQK